MLVDGAVLFLCDAFTLFSVECAAVKFQAGVGASPAEGQAAEPLQIMAIEKGSVMGPSPPAKVRPDASLHLVAGLTQLLRALDYATGAGRDVWDFAVEISDLRNAGMTTGDMRWLVSMGFAHHGQETSVYGAPHRCFHRGEGLTFLPTSALVLTPQGAAEVRKLLAATDPSDVSAASASSAVPIHLLVTEPHAPQTAENPLSDLPGRGEPAVAGSPRLPWDVKPAWDARRRELRVGHTLVKKFRVPADNQERILSAFEEEAWPAYIDDPLPMKSETAPKQRLRNTIDRLNGNQLAPLLRFHGNGNGQGIGWQLLSLPAAHESNGAARSANSTTPSMPHLD